MRVVFFDIDGTLIRSGGAGKAAMEEALRALFGLQEIHGDVPYSGRTDGGIAEELLRRHEVEPTRDNVTRLLTEYLRRLPGHLQQKGGQVLPGIREALDAERRGVALGLLTGNTRAGAEIKLRHFGLWNHFEFGGFSDGLVCRNEVARAAVAAAEHHLRRSLARSDMWVAGDTPLDVECARAIGARAIALGTGWHSEEELLAAKPDYYFPDLTHAGPLLRDLGWI